MTHAKQFDLWITYQNAESGIAVKRIESFQKWGIILIVVGGVVILGCIITVLIICRRLKKKKAKGGNEYVTLFGETDSKAIEPPIITN